MKRFFWMIMLLSLCMLGMMLTACGGNDETTPPVTTDDPPSTTTEATTPPTVTTSTPSVDGPDTFEAEHVSLKDNKATVTSLSGDLTMAVYFDAEGNAVYTLKDKTSGEIIAPSMLGLTASNFEGFENATLVSATARHFKASYPYLGNFSTMTDECVAAVLTFDNKGYQFSMEIKLYDDGVSFRYNLPYGGQRRTVRGEKTSFTVNNLGRVWCGQGSDCYESVINSATFNTLSKTAKLNGPLTVELQSGKGYVVLMEGAVSDTYIGTNYTAGESANTFEISGSWTSGTEFDAFSAGGDIVTGWRIINFSRELSGIVTNNIIYHTALGMDENTKLYEDTDWITPGKSAWSWINMPGVQYEHMIEYTLNAARLGFEYNIIDEGYMSWTDYEEKLLEVGLLGEANNVKQILWCAVSDGHNGYQIKTEAQAKVVMKKLVELHMHGIKLDFFHSETQKLTQAIQHATLKEGMENGIIVNFHGVHKPTSMAVLYPNELSREGIRGLEQGLRGTYSEQARYLTRQYYTRFLSGHADFTPDCNTAMQIASMVLMDSPLTVIATNPNDILKNPALEIIRAMPTVWDRTVFLDGAIGSYVVTAKEKDGTWYVGGVYSATKQNVTVDLSKILGDGEYLLTGFKDISTSNKEAISMKVTKDTVFEIGKMATSCGFVLKITKLDISQHGGEISLPIRVTTANASSTVKYTVDGSDPMTSSTAKAVENGTISLDTTCLLRVAITDGDGKGTSLSYQFNEIKYHSVDFKVDYNDGSSTVTLTPTEAGAKIYYTLDGTKPTTSSTLYTAPFTLSEKKTVQAIAVDAEGNVSGVKKLDVMVRTAVTSIKPDVYLGKDYITAVAGWDNRVMVDISMNSTTLSLGGSNTENGTKFSHGISTNAIGYFDYNIPENAKEFVGVAGIDDSAYGNIGDGYKASIIVTIYIDNVKVYTTQKLGQGGFEQIRVSIPEGAKVIRIHFGDAGDGITCDNADLCDGGFILE
ncbi:MAG: glycoside hydrolase family 97 N-terminal domain-containing protein [Clostridia bacterium]|nr:glycoside hydrolase family 97 N-terminal domain-containing protein [Clostridia bacterium]